MTQAGLNTLNLEEVIVLDIELEKIHQILHLKYS